VVADVFRLNRYRIARYFGYDKPRVMAGTVNPETDPVSPQAALYYNLAREIIDALDPIDTAAALARVTHDG